jgi:hypothetical protein
MTIQPPGLIQLQQDRALSYVCFPSIGEFPPPILESLLGGQSKQCAVGESNYRVIRNHSGRSTGQSNNTAKAGPSIATISRSPEATATARGAKPHSTPQSGELAQSEGQPKTRAKALVPRNVRLFPPNHLHYDWLDLSIFAAPGGSSFSETFDAARLVLRRKLLQRDRRRCQCFHDSPFVVAGDSLFYHLDLPLISPRSAVPKDKA